MTNLHFEEENLSKKQQCRALTSNKDGMFLSCVKANRTDERGSARRIFDTLVNRFSPGVQGHQAMVKFAKSRQTDDETCFWMTSNFSEGEVTPTKRYRSGTWPLPQSS